MAEHNGNNSHLPIIGGGKPRIGAGLAAMPRRLDENGTFEGKAAVQGPNGLTGIPHRENFVDAEELVEMIREVVRQELQAALKGNSE